MPPSRSRPRPEIDNRTMKLIVGVVALSLAMLTDVFAHLFGKVSITSISASYWVGGPSQSIFVGFLFAIAAFLLAYNGKSRSEMISSKVAAVAALAIALCPCECDEHPAPVPYVHGGSAAVMFLILAYFCYRFRARAFEKFQQGNDKARLRCRIYTWCGLAIVSSILVLGGDHLSGEKLTTAVPRLTFIGEAVSLVAFGVSWLTSSKVLPALTVPGERFSPLRDENPPDC